MIQEGWGGGLQPLQTPAKPSFFGQKPPKIGQNHHFRAKAKFFRQKPAAKNENFLCVFIKRKNGIHPV